MIMEGCQGRPRTPTLTEKRCPRCGRAVEVFSTDTEVACENCGQTVFNDALSCVRWCRYAEKCVGEAMYRRLREVARAQDARARAKDRRDAHGS